MRPILEEVRLKDVMPFAYGRDLNIAPNADTEVGCEDSAVAVERNMPGVRSEDDRIMQYNVIPNDDQRRAFY